MMINRVFSTSIFFLIILSLIVLVQWTPGENMRCSVWTFSVICRNAEGNFLANVRSEKIAVINIVTSTLMSLSEHDFSKFTNVTQMIIDKCEVPQSILNYTLSLKELKILRIINSNITENYLTALRKSSTLVLLSLKGNNIVEIKKDIFGYLSRLEEIDLSHNKIVAFRADAFPNVSALRKLDLSYNKLSSIFDSCVSKGFFDSISRLKEIDLSHNEIVTVEGGALFGLPALRKLNISHNMIGVIGNTGIFKDAVFDSLLHLEELDLSYNRIQEIKVDAFESLSTLRRLDLSHNALNDDFDLSALLLPAGCVFQSLVATCPAPTTNGHQFGELKQTAQNATIEDPLQKQRLENPQLELQHALHDLEKKVTWQRQELQQTLQDLEQKVKQQQELQQTLQDLERKLKQLLREEDRQQQDIELLKKKLWQQEQEQQQQHQRQEQDEMSQHQGQEEQEQDEKDEKLQWQEKDEARQQSGSRRTEDGARDEHDGRVTDASSNSNTGVSGGVRTVIMVAVVSLLCVCAILLLLLVVLMVFIAKAQNRTID